MGFKFPKIENSLLTCLIIGLGSVSLGTPISYPSPSSPQLQKYLNLSDTQIGWYNSSGFLAAFFGSLIMNLIINKIGRKMSSLIAAIFSFVTYIVIGFSTNYPYLMIFRVLNGATIGFFGAVAPTYINEIAPDDKKGMYGYISQVLIGLGFFFPSLLSMGLKWNGIAFVLAVIPFLLIVFTPFIKNSPNTEQPAPLKDLFKLKKELFIAICLVFFLQYSGVFALLSNLETIVADSGISIQPSIISVLATICQIVSTIGASFLIDRLGRRFCWIASAVGEMIAFILLFLFVLLDLPIWVFLLGLFLEQLSYGFGNGPIPLMLIAELYDNSIRSTGMAYATAINWLFAFSVVYIWPVLDKGLGKAYSFLFFAIVMVISIIFAIFFIKPKQNEELEEDDIETSDCDLVIPEL